MAHLHFTLIETLTDVMVHPTQPIAELLVQDVKPTLLHTLAKRKLATGTSVFQYINLKHIQRQSKSTRRYTYLEFILSSLVFFCWFFFFPEFAAHFMHLFYNLGVTNDAGKSRNKFKKSANT